MDAEIAARLREQSRANFAFNKLTKRLWRKSGIRLMTKIAVYKAAVLSSLLYGSEAWTLPRRLVKKVEKFHLTSLRKIAGIRWYHKVPNFQVLESLVLCGTILYLQSCGDLRGGFFLIS